jgi:putative hydrolase of the HAD superfamily
MMARMTWVIFDFAGVIGQHQPQESLDGMVKIAGAPDPEAFWAAYWRHRESYDAGAVTADRYWAAVLEAVPEAATVARLVEADVASWLFPDVDTVELIGELADRGTGLALYSNCPLELAEALDRLPWLDPIRNRFYSSRLGQVKPDPAAFRTVAGLLGVEPEDCAFVDDRPANVAGAEAAGMTGFVFTDAATLRRNLAAR